FRRVGRNADPEGQRRAAPPSPLPSPSSAARSLPRSLLWLPAGLVLFRPAAAAHVHPRLVWGLQLDLRVSGGALAAAEPRYRQLPKLPPSVPGRPDVIVTPHPVGPLGQPKTSLRGEDS